MRRLIPNILIFTVLIAGGLILPGLLHRTPPALPAVEEKAEGSARRPAPVFSFKDLSGATHSLEDYRDRTVILNFWASWCAPCVIEFPRLLRAVADRGEGTVLIALSLDAEEGAIEKFLRGLDAKSQKFLKNGNVVIGRDEGKAVSQGLFQTYRLPETVFIGPGLVLRGKIAGAEWTDAEFAAAAGR